MALFKSRDSPEVEAEVEAEIEIEAKIEAKIESESWSDSGSEAGLNTESGTMSTRRSLQDIKKHQAQRTAQRLRSGLPMNQHGGLGQAVRW